MGQEGDKPVAMVLEAGLTQPARNKIGLPDFQLNACAR